VAKIGVDIDGLLGSLAQFTSALAFAWPMAKGASYNFQKKYTRCGAVSPGNALPVPMLRADCSLFTLFISSLM
jgi:hypothetical protein